MKLKYAILPMVTAFVIVGLAALAWYHGASISILNPQGPIALQERNVILLTLLLCSIVVIPVFILLFLFAWRYRETPNAKHTHDPEGDHENIYAELFWWTVPTIIIIFLSFVAWQSSHALDPYKSIKNGVAPITIEVVALDWKWLFIYPAQNIATVNYLEIPQNTPIKFEITSDAPMNSLWIPSLGGQIMAMPGMQTELNLLASNKGTFDGSSGNISGNGFAGMHFKVVSVSAADFATWVTSVQQKNTPLTTNLYTELAKPSRNVPALYYSSVAPSLYTGVIMKYMMNDMPSTGPAVSSTTP